ncbi:type II secretion system GspH family protein [bacterium]|nr:type II secretion system GspH family protein [bacterium]
MKTKKGMALIMVLVMIIIFSSLILAVVISSTTAIRRAHFYKDKTTALTIAESGIQDAFYWLNHKGYDHQDYPTSDYYFQGSSSDGTTVETWISYRREYNPTGIPNAKCRVQITTTGNPNEDTLTSTGYYKGRSATISVNIRGENASGTPLNNNKQGIADPFNKKVIYASTVAIPNPNDVSIKGNITTSSTKPDPFPWTDATWTETEIHIPTHNISTPNIPLMPTTPHPDYFTEIYDGNGYVERPGDAQPLQVNALDIGVYWDQATRTYIFGRTNDNLGPRDFASVANIQIVSSNARMHALGGNINIRYWFKVDGGDIEIKKDIRTPANLNSAFEVDSNHSVTVDEDTAITGNLVVRNGSLTLNKTTVNGTVLTSSEIEILEGTVINGSLVTKNNLTIRGDTEETVINGSVLASNDVTISGDTTINATNSTYESAIIMNSNTTEQVLTIKKPLTIKLGDPQRAAIYSFDANKIKIDVEDAFSLEDNDNNRFCIINESNDLEININVDEDSNPIAKESIYSKHNITIDTNNTIEGLLIAGGILTITKGTIVYDPAPYLNKSNSEVYKGFTGSRRKYLPVPNSWKITW